MQFWPKIMVVMLVMSFLMAGGEETMVVGGNSRSASLQEIKPKQEPQQRQGLRHSFGAFFSNKRKVPNASDPLHNR
ncbi:hypothetical protein SLEP1_g21683 [Rubroshorea leprosula]|uniref:Uncharacterized protein n=1 Tax=Rubroshorea leprosula TaxID=152421 RepID=A0AAV5JFH8_9ROSI|nr:hypothetical protein SLEP1_g21683 [Rubroshorea leprosula]